MSITVLEIPVSELDTSEALRYMRAGKNPGSEIIASVECAKDKILSAVRAKACYTELGLELCDGGKMKLGSLMLQSKSLEKRLLGCRSAFLIAVTAGADVDRIIRAEAAVSALGGLVADVLGSCAVEAACDCLNERIDGICKSTGRFTRARFSAGYGDLSLEYQKDICAILDTKKNIGAALGEGTMMMPSKTVTAIIGVC